MVVILLVVISLFPRLRFFLLVLIKKTSVVRTYLSDTETESILGGIFDEPTTAKPAQKEKSSPISKQLTSPPDPDAVEASGSAVVNGSNCGPRVDPDARSPLTSAPHWPISKQPIQVKKLFITVTFIEIACHRFVSL